MTLTVRKIVGKRQQQTLYELQKLCLPDDDAIKHNPKGCSIGVYDGDKLVAFGLARKSWLYQETMYLSRAGVHPDYRGQGLQKLLIELREEWGRKKGLKYSATDTDNSSVASMRSLIACGYRPFWPQLVKPWALETSVYWRKNL